MLAPLICSCFLVGGGRIGGDDGVRTCLAHRHLEATSGNCLTPRTRDLAFRQQPATAFSSMFAPCLHE